MRHLKTPPPNGSVPTAICRHDPDYPLALGQMPSAPAVLHATCTVERLRALVTGPTVAIVGGREHSGYAHDVTIALARDLAESRGNNHQRHRSGRRSNRASQCAGRRRAHDRGYARRPAAPLLPPPPEPASSDPHPWRSGLRVPPSFPTHPALVLHRQPADPRRHRRRGCHRRDEGKGERDVLVALVAAEVGNDVAVVPGRVTDPGGLRTFGLLRDGAHPVACAADVLDLIGHAGVRGVAA